MRSNRVPQLAGPLLFLLIVLAPAPPGMSPQAQFTAGVTAWMAVWWISEVVHTAVTALLPLVLFPLGGVMPLTGVSAEFGNQIIFLFLAGFLFGRAIEAVEPAHSYCTPDGSGFREQTGPYCTGIYGGYRLYLHVDIQHRHGSDDDAGGYSDQQRPMGRYRRQPDQLSQSPDARGSLCLLHRRCCYHCGYTDQCDLSQVCTK